MYSTNLPGTELTSSVSILYILYIGVGAALSIAGSKYRRVSLASIIFLFFYDYTSLLIQQLVNTPAIADYKTISSVLNYITESSTHLILAVLLISLIVSCIAIALSSIFFKTAVFFLCISFFLHGPGVIIFDTLGITDDRYKLIGTVVLSLVAAILLGGKVVNVFFKAVFASVGVFFLLTGANGLASLNLSIPQAVFGVVSGESVSVPIQELLAFAGGVLLSYVVQSYTE